MIEVRGIHKRFGDVTAVADASFVAEDGQITGLLGPNGAGKTTTLRILYGLIRPDQGELSIDGIDVLREPQRAQTRLGALPDSRGLYPRLSARENVRYYGRLHGLQGEDLERRIDELRQQLEWGDWADRRVAGFSQGERMKVAIARALIHRPANVVLDEPTNGLDVMSTRAMREFIRTLRAEGRCVLFSSHVMQEVSALCDRILIIARGRMVAAGTPDELRAKVGADDLEEVFIALTADPAAADPEERT
jgi:sodium transport system ATP-binding protein